jgi:GTPase
MLSLVMPRDGWHPPVIRTVATENKGIDELAHCVGKFSQHFQSSGERRKKHIEHWQNRLIEMLESRLLERVLGGKDGEAKLRELAAAVADRKIDPFSAVSGILKDAGL